MNRSSRASQGRMFRVCVGNGSAGGRELDERWLIGGEGKKKRSRKICKACGVGRRRLGKET